MWRNDFSAAQCGLLQSCAVEKGKLWCDEVQCNKTEDIKAEFLSPKCSFKLPHLAILRFILPCKSECQLIFQNSFQIFQIKFLFLVQNFQKHIALLYFFKTAICFFNT